MKSSLPSWLTSPVASTPPTFVEGETFFAAINCWQVDVWTWLPNMKSRPGIESHSFWQVFIELLLLEIVRKLAPDEWLHVRGFQGCAWRMSGRPPRSGPRHQGPDSHPGAEPERVNQLFSAGIGLAVRQKLWTQ